MRKGDKKETRPARELQPAHAAIVATMGSAGDSAGAAGARTSRVEVPVRGERVPLTVVEAGRGPSEDLLFLHGYGRSPRDYQHLLEELAALGHRVLAPYLFANGALRRPPTHFWSCTALAHRTAAAMLDQDLLARGAPVVGHSTGGAVTLTFGRGPLEPEALVAINPVQPSERSTAHFVIQAARIGAKRALGLAGEVTARRRPEPGRSSIAWLRSPLRNVRLIGGLREFDHEALARWIAKGPDFEGPVTVIYGHGDEFYPSAAGMVPGLRRLFPRFELVELQDEVTHTWPMLRPQRAAALVQGALRP